MTRNLWGPYSGSEIWRKECPVLFAKLVLFKQLCLSVIKSTLYLICVSNGVPVQKSSLHIVQCAICRARTDIFAKIMFLIGPKKTIFCRACAIKQYYSTKKSNSKKIQHNILRGFSAFAIFVFGMLQVNGMHHRLAFSRRISSSSKMFSTTSIDFKLHC